MPDGNTISKIRDANAAISEIIGLSVSQWRQVVMLAQGQFRKLLTAETAERGQILASIFETQRFAKVAEALKEMASSSVTDTDSVRGDILAKLRAMPSSEGSEARKALAEKLESDGWIYDASAVVVLAEGVLKEDEALLEKAKADEEAKMGEQMRLTEELTVADNLSKSFETYDSAVAELNGLMSKKDEMDVLRTVTEKRKVALYEVNPYNLAHSRALSAAQSVREKLAEAEAKLKSAESRVYKAGQKIDLAQKNDEAEEGLRAEASSIRELLENYETVASAQKDQMAAEKEKSRAEQRKTQIQGKLIELDEERGLCREFVDGNSDIESLLAKAETELEDLRGVRDSLEKLGKSAERYAGLSANCEIVRGEYLSKLGEKTAADDECRDVEERFYKGQAASLASGLREGAPCPVCGSVHHPSPAVSAEAVPDKSEVDGCRRRRESLAEECDSLHKILIDAESDVRATKATCDAEAGALPEGLVSDWTGAGIFDSARESVRIKIEGAESEHSRLSKLSTEYKAKKAHIDEIDPQREGMNDELVTLEGEIGKQNGKIAAAKSVIEGTRLDPRYTTKSEASEAIGALETMANNLRDSLEAAKAEYSEANANHSAAKSAHEVLENQLAADLDKVRAAATEFSDSLSRSGFADEAEYKRMCDKERYDSDRAVLENYDRALLSAQSAVETAGKAVEGKQRPGDLAELRSRKGEADAAYSSSAGTRASVDLRLYSNRETVSEVRGMLEEFERKDRKRSELANLSAVANGTMRGMKGEGSFEEYIQRVHLEMILREAARRMRTMSDGRYVLRRSTTPSDGTKSHSLDIDILDNDTGKVRPVRTLSGGESFKAALSMALGLSDVIQNNAGGRRIQDLFIDEGFGSLDPDSLKQAVKVLTDLTDGSKTVGIISHVEELKNRIDRQVIVEYDEGRGSRLRIRKD